MCGWFGFVGSEGKGKAREYHEVEDVMLLGK